MYGSSTGTCEEIAGKIAAALGAETANAGDIDRETLEGCDNILLGSSTWGAGELQDDWYGALDVVKGCDLSGKAAAVFGCGDSSSYPDTFCNAMKELYDAAAVAGAVMVGQTATEGYTFDDSEAVVDGKFVGLPIDNDGEGDKTDERIGAWIEAIRPHLR